MLLPLINFMQANTAGIEPLRVEFSRADLEGVLPATLMFATGIVALLADLLVGPSQRGGSTPEELDADLRSPKSHLSFIGIGGGVLALMTLWFGSSTGETILKGALRADAFSDFASAIIIVAAILTSLSAGSYLGAQGQNRGEFHGLLWLGGGAMVVLTQATNLISIFVAIETLSLSVYVLAGFFREWKKGSEGAIKYFVMGAFSSGFLLLGMAFLYGATQSIDLAALADPAADRYLLILGLLLCLIGLAFKVGAVPFHSWVPDVYQGAPAIAAGWMAVAVKAASFAVLLRLVVAAGAKSGVLVGTGLTGGFEFERTGEAIGTIIAVIALSTMILGNLAALNQTNIKRMLAYSGIAHSGYLMIPIYLALRGEGRVEVGAAVLYYLVAYLLMTFGAFAVVATVSRGDSDREDIESFNGLAKSHPLLAFAMTVSLMSLAGIPLTGGFIGKLFVFKGAVLGAVSGDGWNAGLFNLALVGILASIVSVYYYLRPIVAMYFRESDRPILKVEAPWGLHLTLVITSVATFAVGLFPARLHALSKAAAESLGGGS